MKYFYFKFLILFFFSLSMNSQSLDTLVDIGGYKMHFKIIKGEGTPILFETGAGDDGSIWNDILEKIHKVTGTTLITYDRSGFGKSELNPNLKNESDFGIVNGIKELETGLSKLGFNNEIILISHSYGGLYNLLYTHKHPKKVISSILIDVTLNDFWSEELLIMRDENIDISSIEKPSGDYYLNFNFNETMRYMREIHFPEDIPIINIFPENSFPNFPEVLTNRWTNLHKQFGENKNNVINIIAQGSGHYIFQDNPGLIINTIIKAYSETLNENERNVLLKKALDNAIELSIEAKKTEIENKEKLILDLKKE
ncbi:alpha/beta fold hydrolase [Winogradskyella wichelsiae]|uniref:alpha/beta fold hydrolase n=1 Tax=Winogradskyella wichelsiae TaxID=2697007 RepID=UPI003EF4DE5E